MKFITNKNRIRYMIRYLINGTELGSIIWKKIATYKDDGILYKSKIDITDKKYITCMLYVTKNKKNPNWDKLILYLNGDKFLKRKEISTFYFKKNLHFYELSSLVLFKNGEGEDPNKEKKEELIEFVEHVWRNLYELTKYSVKSRNELKDFLKNKKEEIMDCDYQEELDFIRYELDNYLFNFV